jgi:chromosome segregation ATPase
MGLDASLPKLSQYIEDAIRQIDGARQEMEEIQVGFNSNYVEWKANHDAALERLVETVLESLDEVGPDLQGRIDERAADERRTIAARRKELRDTLVPQTQAEADTVLKEGQSIIEMMREENPRLNEKEEQLKARKDKFESELADLNEQIRKLSRWLGVVFNFFKINRLDKKRQQAIGQLYYVHSDLKEVREEWVEVQEGMETEEKALQARWQELAQKLAQLQAELGYLDEEANREALALRRAVRNAIDGLVEPIPCHVDTIKAALDEMVEMNVQTDAYQEGLGAVSGVMSLLMGIGEGMKRFDASVEGLVQQQRMHSAYLSPLDVYVPDDVTTFHAQWGELTQMVRDDGHLCKNPADFLALMRPVMEQGLSEEKVTGMFESLGEALSAATSRWG